MGSATKPVMTVFLQARVEAELAKKAEMIADIQGISMSTLIRKAIENYLSESTLDVDGTIKELERQHAEKIRNLGELRKWQQESVKTPATQ